MPGFGHCFAYIEWPAYSSAPAQAFALVLSYSFVPYLLVFHRTVFIEGHYCLPSVISSALSSVCCKCSPRVPLQFPAYRPNFSNSGYHIGIFSIAYLIELLWAIVLSISVSVCSWFHCWSDGWCNKSYSWMLHYCCIIQLFYQIFFFLYYVWTFVHFWQEKKVYACNIAHKH